jgi:transcriptional regulator with XRE-family HTH domain
MTVTARQAFGASIRTSRAARGWTQRELAARAGVRQSVVCAVESGDGARFETLEKLCIALDGELRLEARLPFAGEGVGQSDVAHARCVGAARRILTPEAYECATEQLVTDGPWRGWIDLVGYCARTRRLVVVEVKTELRDAGGLERQVDRYVRRCLDVARRHGWRVSEVVVVVLVLATAEADAFIIANRDVMESAFPVRGREAIAALLDRGPVRGRMLLMLDPRRRGRRALSRSRADGRRTQAPYRDARAYLAAATRS